MKRTKRLILDRETVRQLASATLTTAKGGGGLSIAPEQTCSMCVGYTGCQTGDACP